MAALTELVCGDVVRTVAVPEVPEVPVHEVLARTMLESVTSGWNHRHSFAASTLCRVDGALQVKMNAAAVLRREVRRKSWRRETVVLGAGPDPYHPVEDRYRLMPQVLAALSESQTPIALHTSSMLLVRDLPLLRLIGRTVPVTVSVSLATLDAGLSARIEPSASPPQARLEMIERLAAAGLAPHIRIAPLPPLLADGTAQLDDLLRALADAGAARVSVSPMRLDTADAADFLHWLGGEHPALVRRYRSLYGRRTFVSAEYAMGLRARMTPLVERHGLGSERSSTETEAEAAAELRAQTEVPAVVRPAACTEVTSDELTLF